MLLPGNKVQMLDNLPRGNALEVETLATGEDSWQHFMHICGGQDKDSIAWRLLQGLEQGIKGFGGQHVRFVKHINLVLTRGGRHHDLFAQVTDAVNTTIGSGINLDDIERVASGNLTALLALVAGFPIDWMTTIDGFSQETGSTRLAGSSRAGEEIGMCEVTITERVFERANDRFLPNEVTESLRTPFAVERL